MLVDHIMHMGGTVVYIHDKAKNNLKNISVNE